MNDWDKFIKEGDIIYNYLLNHFDQMFNSDLTIKHFDMTYMSYSMGKYYEEVYDKYGKQIHDAILPWIHEEYRSGRLLNKIDWKPFRDQLSFTQMYYGYRKLFLFEKYYLQLAIVNGLYDSPDELSLKSCICFEVALYGWKNNEIHTLQPLNDVIISDNMRIPEQHWERK